MNKLWCYIEGENVFFGVHISSSDTVDDLKEVIHAKGLHTGYARDLTLTKVRYIMVSVNIDVMYGLCWLMTSAG